MKKMQFSIGTKKRTIIVLLLISAAAVTIFTVYQIQKPQLVFTVHDETRDYQRTYVKPSDKKVIFSEKDIEYWDWENGMIYLTQDFYDRYGNDPLIASYPEINELMLPSPTQMEYIDEVYSLVFRNHVLCLASVSKFPPSNLSYRFQQIAEHDRGIRVEISDNFTDVELKELYDYLLKVDLL